MSDTKPGNSAIAAQGQVAVLTPSLPVLRFSAGLAKAFRGELLGQE